MSGPLLGHGAVTMKRTLLVPPFEGAAILGWEADMSKLGHLGGSVVERLPSAQGVILGPWDQVPHWAPCMEPASPSACVSASLSLLSLSVINKYIKP